MEFAMQDLLAAAARLGALLTARHETIVIAESSTGGLMAAALLAGIDVSTPEMHGGLERLAKATKKIFPGATLPFGMVQLSPDTRTSLSGLMPPASAKYAE